MSAEELTVTKHNEADCVDNIVFVKGQVNYAKELGKPMVAPLPIEVGITNPDNWNEFTEAYAIANKEVNNKLEKVAAVLSDIVNVNAVHTGKDSSDAWVLVSITALCKRAVVNGRKQMQLTFLCTWTALRSEEDC